MRFISNFKALRFLILVPVLGLFASNMAWTHSVGQVQTTKFLAPETVTLLTNRITAGQPPGFQVGDVISYIIQFTPVANGAVVGVAGYVTDYLPGGVEVVDAAVVNKDASGNFVNTTPSFPGGIADGVGGGANNFLAPFNTAAYDPTGRCTAGGFTNNCNARLMELYADTGIFYSTDPRTAQFPPLPTRILQSVNGYNINPSAAGQLNPIIGQNNATTHNLWDADQTNAFGTAPNSVTGLVAPKSAAAALTANGRGPTPFYAGSAVAGPQTGYPLDNTAQIGPWLRIAYPGSRIGNTANGPAPANTTIAVGGALTPLGYNLSLANPLPPGTNAVRWAVGKLVVGTVSYVKISLRVTQPVPTQGLTNGSEVFGGDAGDADVGKDSAWRYHIPSVADNNSNLFIQKVPCVFDATATTCVPLSGVYYPANSIVTYQITYINTGSTAQTSATLSDILPCQTANGALIRVGAITGPLAAVRSTPYTTQTTIAGNCNAPQVRAVVTFPTIPLLAAGSGGSVIINVPNSANGLNDTVSNTAKMTTTLIPSGAVSNGVTIVGNANAPFLTVAKTVVASSTPVGGTDQYVIVIRNTGTSPATGITISDILPSTGSATVDPTTRFNFTSPTVSISTSLLTTSTALVTNSTTAALGGLTPYSTAVGAANMVQVNWAFGAGNASSLAAGGVITITFNVTVGVNMATSATPYGNNVQARYIAPQFTGNAGTADLPNAAGVILTSPLTVTKTLACYYSGGSCLTPPTSGNIPANAKVRYRIDYANIGATPIANVTLTDTLPCQISSTSVSITVSSIVSGPISATGTTPYFIAGPFTGNCPATKGSFGFAPTTLAVGQTGALTIEAQLTTPASTSTVVVNQVRLSSPNAPSAVSQVQNTALTTPNLQITKGVSSTAVYPGSTVSYTLNIVDVGTEPATSIAVYDWLPTGTSTVANASQRFSYASTAAISGGLTSVLVVINSSPTQAPYSATSGNLYAANQQELVWTFTGQSLAVGATASIVLTAAVGSALPVLPPPNYYNNNAKVNYATGQSASSNASSVNVSPVASLSISKSNGTNTVIAGGTTTYTLIASNGGPAPADNAVVRDSPGVGLNCTTVSCPVLSLVGGASCPASLANFFTTGSAIPLFPANSSVTFLVNCGVTATGQ